MCMSMSNNKHFSRHCIQHSRFTKQDGWRLWDLSLGLDGNIAVTCYNEKTHQTSIDVYSVRNSDSRDKPKIFYSKEFEKYEDEESIYLGRYVSFVEPDVNGDNIGLVTCIGDNVQVIDLIQDRVLKSRKVTLVNHGGIHCLSVKERREIFIGFRRSNKITVCDVIDLNEIKSIILQGIQDGYWPDDMTAIADRIFVCEFKLSEESNQRSLIFEEKNGRILSELTKPTDTHWYAGSVTVSVTLGVVAVVWYDSWYRREGIRVQILFYSLLSENISSFLIVEIESGVDRIRISDRGDRMVTMNLWTGEVKVYDMAELFTYSNLEKNLASQLKREDCVSLAKFFSLPKDDTDIIEKTGTPTEILLLALQERGVVQESNVGRLTEAFDKLGIRSSCSHVTDIYQKSRRSSFSSETMRDLTQSFKVMSNQLGTSLDRQEEADITPESKRWANMFSRINAEVDTLKSVGSIKYSKTEQLGAGCYGSHIYGGKFGSTAVAVKRIVNENVQKEPQLYDLMKAKPMCNVLKILHIEKDDDFTYVVTKLCEYDLKAVIEDDNNPVGGSLTSEKRVKLCADILRGLNDLHSIDVIHRDLKPDNILIDVNGDAFVADFGISRNLIGDTTQVTSSYGTLCWIAHESSQSGNDKVKYKKASDVQVCGCLMYYVLSNGHHPFEATFPFIKNVPELMSNVAKGNFSLLHVKRYPDQCTALLHKMLDQDMSKRPTIDVCLKEVEGSAFVSEDKRGKDANLDSNTNGGSSAYLSETEIKGAYGELTVKVVEQLTPDNCNMLACYFNFPPAITEVIKSGKLPGIELLDFMKQRNIINRYDVTMLQEALKVLNLNAINQNLVTPYHKKIDPRIHKQHKIEREAVP